jgi:hypothetical protein
MEDDMKSLDIVEEVRGVLKELKEQGQTNIPIINLENYINNVERTVLSSNSQSIENKERELLFLKQKFERDIEAYRYKTLASLEMFRSVIEAGMNALKSAILINGGAAIALLTLMGEITQKNTPNLEFNKLGLSLFVFIVATGFAGAASGLRYLTQAVYAWHYESQLRGNPNKYLSYLGTFFNTVTVVLGIASFVGFFCGGWHAYQALVR